jgi:hypothetical protein
MKINMRLNLTTTLTIVFSLITVTALIGTATALPQDSPTNSPKIVETGHMTYRSIAAVVGSNPLSLSNSTTGDSSEIDLNLLQVLPAPQA